MDAKEITGQFISWCMLNFFLAVIIILAAMNASNKGRFLTAGAIYAIGYILLFFSAISGINPDNFSFFFQSGMIFSVFSLEVLLILAAAFAFLKKSEKYFRLHASACELEDKESSPEDSAPPGKGEYVWNEERGELTWEGTNGGDDEPEDKKAEDK